jgi:hypothetical protein
VVFVLVDFFQRVPKMKAAGNNRVNHDADMILEDGSNTENKLVIIFILLFLTLGF